MRVHPRAMPRPPWRHRPMAAVPRSLRSLGLHFEVTIDPERLSILGYVCRDGRGAGLA